MTAIESMKAASSSLLFGSQGLNKTQNAQTSEDTNSSAITSSNSQSSAANIFGINTPSINPATQVGTQSSESSKVNSTGLNTSYLSSKLFSGNTVGINDNIQTGSTVYTAGQTGKADGVSRTICIA